jgi:hypothetical protein
LWIAKTTRFARTIPLSDQQRSPDETEIKVGSAGILFDRDGAPWITTIGEGPRRSPAPELLKGRIKEFSTEVESFTAKDGFSADVVRAILQGREGNIWVGTNCGVDRFPMRASTLSSFGLYFDWTTMRDLLSQSY